MDAELEEFFVAVALSLGKPNFPMDSPGGLVQGKARIPLQSGSFEYLQKFLELAQKLNVRGTKYPTDKLTKMYKHWYARNTRG